MIEKPKRPKKIPNQDNKQPQTIQELIRRYDLDNTKIYDFLDELVGNLNKKDSYSTDEQVIGTWIDGKPIYRKTKQTTLKKGPNALGKPSSNLNLLVNVYGILRYTKSTDGTERMMSLTRVHYNDINNQIGWFYSGVDNNIWVEVGTNYTDEITAYITYEYTKTTD